MSRSSLFIAMFVVMLSGCSSIPGISLISDMNDVNAIARSNLNMPLEELREIASRPLVQQSGISHDVGLMRRGIAQSVLSDIPGLRHTKQLALDRAVLQSTKAEVIRYLAAAERTRMNYRAALKEYAEAERFMVAAAKQDKKPLLEHPPFYGFVQDYLYTADSLGDKALSTRLREEYVRPIVTSPRTPPGRRLYLSMALNAPNEASAMDPFAKYNRFKGLIEEYDRSIDGARKANPELSRSLEISFFAIVKGAGFAALSAGLYPETGEQLKRLRYILKASGLAAVGNIELAELEQNYAFALGNYRSAERDLDQMWAALPPAFRQEDTVFPVIFAGQKAGYLVAAGDWRAAANVLSGLQLERTEDSSEAVDYFIGLRSLVHAVLGEPSRHLREFAGMARKYRKLRGTDFGYHYAAAQTIIYNRQASITGKREDHLKAVEGGRDMARTLRIFESSGFGQTSIIAPTVAAMAKEAYVASASALLESGGGAVDDLLDALHLLYSTETDRDISAMISRAKTIPGLSQTQVRQLQDAQREVRAAQQRIQDFAKIQDLEPERMEQAGETARVASQRLAALLEKLQAIPQFQQAFGNAEPPNLQSIQARLAPGEGLALLAPLKDATLIMVITKKTHSQRLVDLPASRAEVLVDRIRRTLRFNPLREFDTDAASEIYSELFGWNPSLPKQLRSLTVIAKGALSKIPFSLLVTQPLALAQAQSYRDTPWLIRAMSVTHAPSIRSWYALAGPQSGANGQGFIAWANPAYGGANGEAAPASSTVVRGTLRAMKSDNNTLLVGLPADLAEWLAPLPETFDEASAIARALGSPIQSAVLHGDAATRSSVLARSQAGELAKYNVVMFATHGLMPAEVPGIYQPALALAQERSEKVPSLLQLEDILTLRMNADWVILSACNTAAADKMGGDPLSGLARGFFYAGARGMLVTHWAVETKSATAITTRTIERHVRDKKLSRAQALQLASIDLIEGRNAPDEWAHPAFWAPYALVGNGRR